MTAIDQSLLANASNLQCLNLANFLFDFLDLLGFVLRVARSDLSFLGHVVRQ